MIIDPSVIRQVSREKDIDAEKMFAALEEAMSSAARKFYHDKAVVTAIDRKTGEMAVTSRRTVVEELDTESEEPPPQILLSEAQELVAKTGTKGDVRVLRPSPEGELPAEVSQLGDEIVQHREPIGLGRIAAQTAKQVLYQKVREAERDNIYNEFQPKIGELMSGTVKRFERGDMIVDLGRTEAIAPRDQQSRAERYGQGERIRAILFDVHRNPKGPQLVLSRTDPRLLIRLFEMEVPEIYDGTVVIKGAVRQPGERAKVAVRSRERDVDPVGACVGMRGSRVQSIMRELHGEKIDVILYSDDLITFAQNALAPAKITRKKKKPKEIAVVIADNSTGCEACVPFCPVDCIEHTPRDTSDRVNVIIPNVQIRLDECIGCKICVNVCERMAWDAIEMWPTESVEELFGIKIHDKYEEAVAHHAEKSGSDG